ncbi:hypothetical protein, partial [Serratia sp. CY43514]|uniref:hypothetical protein n=1 Tax=Serratia sp. CY43514 TaxID=3383620 RepID=UPI0040271DC9
QQLSDGVKHPLAAQQAAALPGKIHQAIWNFVFYMNSKRVLAQENNVWLAVQFYAWRRIWGEFTSDERAVNGSSSGRAGPKGRPEVV